VNGRRRMNFIREIDIDGRKVTKPIEVKEGIEDYFRNHFRKASCQRPNLRGLDLKRLADQERDMLERLFCMEEIWEAISVCDGNKAPGLAGMNLNFIKAYYGEFKMIFSGLLMNSIRRVPLLRG
jgi:hypothetical protein